jgi:hypothetical protein
MDADLYEHLKSTITSDPHQQQRIDDSDGGNDRNQGGNEGHRRSESESLNDTTRHQRTMSSSLPEEIDQVVHAISSSQWAARLGNLMGSVKKQVL